MIMANDIVGYLEIRLAGGDPNATQDLIDIHGNQQFYLGRNPALCERHWSDPTISNKHLRIHCILYEKLGTGEVPPLVYATDVSSNGTFLKKKNASCVSSQIDHGVLLTRKHGAFLLNDKDELRISDWVTLIYHDMESIPDIRLTLTQENEHRQFASRYLLTGRLLGKGGFGKVVVGIHQKSQRQLACKVINLKEFYKGSVVHKSRMSTREETQSSKVDRSEKRWPSKILRCSREFKILKNLSHPNIISVEKVFWSHNTIYLFQELITGGDLFSYMERKGEPLTSLEAAVIVLQTLKAVDYLHDRDIVHRDLKPDNILLSFPEDGARIVITDFGSATVLPTTTGNKSRRMFSNAGTLEYIAPEVPGMNTTMPKELGYSKAVDMWSIGVITANLLSGEAVFAAPCEELDPRKAILELAARCDISIIDDLTHHAWIKVGDKPKDFVRNLIVLREEDRMSVKQALAHPWFTNPYLAAEFEALYGRSIRDWQPRRKVSKLVEPIYMPPTENGLATQTHSHSFQQPSVQASFRVQEHFTSSQDWDFSVVYPPSEGESIAAEHEETHYDESSRRGQYPYQLGTQPGYENPRDSIDDSINQLSLEHDPPASGMYPSHQTESNGPDQYVDTGSGNEVASQPHHTPHNPLDPPVIFKTPMQNYDSLISSPVIYPPLTHGLPDDAIEPSGPSPGSETSVVYETPIRDSQLREFACYSAAFGEMEPDDEHGELANAHKR